MERKGQTAIGLSGDEVVLFIRQKTEEFSRFLNVAIADVGDGETGGRMLVFSTEAEADELVVLGASVEPPIAVS